MGADQLRAFISYSYRDRRLARLVKEGMAAYGIDAFLAHDDIEPSVEWAREIQAQLASCDLFLPLLTKSFSASSWTDQESGISIGLGKHLIPLKVGVDPYGFLASIQAVKTDAADPTLACHKIAQVVATRAGSKDRFLDGLVRMFSESFSFEEAGRCADLLTQFKGYSQQQVRGVLLAVLQNNQIYRSFIARRRLLGFFSEHGKTGGKELLAKAREKIG